jgi:hypothetical protein
MLHRRPLLIAGLSVPILILLIVAVVGAGSPAAAPVAAIPFGRTDAVASAAALRVPQAAELRRERRDAALRRAAELAAERRAAAVRRAAHAEVLRRARLAVVVHRARHAAAVRRAHFVALVHGARRAAAACHRRHRGPTCRVRHRATIRWARHALHRAARRAVSALHSRLSAIRHPARNAAAVRAAHRKARREAVRRARLRAAFLLPRRTHPAHIVRGHYLRSLVGTVRDVRAMRALGAADARRNPAGMGHLVLLDIGGQARRGVFLSTTRRFVSYRALARALRGYVAGYRSRQHRDAPVTIAIGTNNDLYTSHAAGRLWAKRVVNPVRAAAGRYRGAITVAGADDIEPGFRARPPATRAWLRGFLHATRAPFVFNGSADGCSPARVRSRCGHGWRAVQLAALAGGAAPKRILALPQVYNPTMAAQWAQISRTAKLLHRHPLRILGPLTEQAACGRDPSCPSMPSRRAWLLLNRQLRRARVHPWTLPVQVDLDVR